MKRSAGIISLTIGLVTAIQIIGQIIVARIFGARMELDAFVSAVTLPTILITIITGTLNDAYLPLLKKKQLKNEDEGNVYFIKMVIYLSLIMLACALLLDVFSTQILHALFGSRGESFVAFTGSLMRWMTYSMTFIIVGTFGNAYLYSKGRLVIPSLAYLAGSIINLSLIITLSPHIGIWSMVVGFVATIAFQFNVVFPYRILSYFKAALKSFFEPGTKSELLILFIAWVPLIISSLAVRFDSILMRSFSARLPEGYIVYVNLVSKLFAGLVGIMTIGVQTVMFPHLVELIHTKNFLKADSQVNKAKLAGFVMTVFIVAFIFFVAPFFMRILLTGGKFTQQNVEILISLFPYFLIPAIGWGISQLYFQPLIVLGKQYVLTCINICAVALSWLIASITYTYFGGLIALSSGLIVLAFTGIVGAEVVWQIEKKKLLTIRE
ncbi:MAG: lipid II flippase MurJ [Patescibacteria group bacterium]|jgi:putative peptidoglycan lipid II flippase